MFQQYLLGKRELPFLRRMQPVTHPSIYPFVPPSVQPFIHGVFAFCNLMGALSPFLPSLPGPNRSVRWSTAQDVPPFISSLSPPSIEIGSQRRKSGRTDNARRIEKIAVQHLSPQSELLTFPSLLRRLIAWCFLSWTVGTGVCRRQPSKWLPQVA